jgi:hypothetical protein
LEEKSGLLDESKSFLSSLKNGFLELFFFMILQHHCCSLVLELSIGDRENRVLVKTFLLS